MSVLHVIAVTGCIICVVLGIITKNWPAALGWLCATMWTIGSK